MYIIGIHSFNSIYWTMSTINAISFISTQLTRYMKKGSWLAHTHCSLRNITEQYLQRNPDRFRNYSLKCGTYPLSCPKWFQHPYELWQLQHWRNADDQVLEADHIPWWLYCSRQIRNQPQCMVWLFYHWQLGCDFIQPITSFNVCFQESATRCGLTLLQLTTWLCLSFNQSPASMRAYRNQPQSMVWLFHH